MALLVVDGAETVTMTVAVVAEDIATSPMAVAMVVAEKTVTEVTAAVTVTTTTMLHVELTATPALATIATAVEAMSAVEEDTMTETDTTEVAVMTDQLETWLLQLPMVIQLLAERLESHTEVEATMMKDTPVVNINADRLS